MPNEVLQIGRSGTRKDRESFVRLWLSEGCPHAFSNCPAIWEELRSWLGLKLDVCPKNVTLVGSGRVGFSLKPSNWGNKFSIKSDLDLAIISLTLFNNVVDSFHAWIHDYDSDIVNPRSEKERHFWNENKKFGELNIPQGFYDSNKLPTLDRYPLAQKLGNTMWLLTCKLNMTFDAPNIQYTTARIYKDWKSLIRRVSYNVRWATCRV